MMEKQFGRQFGRLNQKREKYSLDYSVLFLELLHFFGEFAELFWLEVLIDLGIVDVVAAGVAPDAMHLPPQYLRE